jgi:hypothetical protein
MGFNLLYLRRSLALAAMASVMAFSAQAQGGGTRQGQPILFSSPDTENVDSNNMPSLSPKLPGALDLEGMAQAPENFNLNIGGNSAPLPLGPGGSGETAQEQDRRRNWMLLTPAEILGAATPEKMMGITERDAFGQPKNLTAMERYTERQNRMQLLLAKTNAMQAGDASSPWNYSGDSFGVSNSFGGEWRNPEAMASPFFNSNPDRQTLARQDGNSAWSRLFSQPAMMPAPSLSQQGDRDMERFRQLLNPGLSSVTPMETSSADGLKTSLPKTLLGSSQDRPYPNRAGASFTPLSSGISKPPDLPKLPTAWSLSYTSTPPAAAWAPQQAPWLTPGPQPFVAPQRRF